MRLLADPDDIDACSASDISAFAPVEPSGGYDRSADAADPVDGLVGIVPRLMPSFIALATEPVSPPITMSADSTGNSSVSTKFVK